MIWFLFVWNAAWAADTDLTGFAGQIESTRASIAVSEKQQREAMGDLFTINKRIKEIAKRGARLVATQVFARSRRYADFYSPHGPVRMARAPRPSIPTVR